MADAPVDADAPSTSGRSVRIAVEGCCHGDLDRIYETIAELDKLSLAQEGEGEKSKSKNKKVELLVVCGDFQAVRNLDDLECLACPPKYRSLRQFYKYYSGERKAPVLTVFVGGNHEASNHLGGLPFGGWVAPNIFYLGNAGAFYFKGLRIAGLSGIFNPRHYRLGRHERPPYDADSLRSAYHVREVDCWRLGSLSVGPCCSEEEEEEEKEEKKSENGDGENGNGGGYDDGGKEKKKKKDPSSSSSSPSRSPPFINNNQRIDLFVSHDWPSNIALHGDAASLTRTKKHLASEVADGSLGSPPGEALLRALRPRYWFSAHLHVKFAALVRHGKKKKKKKEGKEGRGEKEGEQEEEEEEEEEKTRFLALDKCVPGRQFLQVLDIPVPASSSSSSSDEYQRMAEDEEEGRLRFDPHWLAVVAKSYGLSESRRRAAVELPGGGGGGHGSGGGGGGGRGDFRVLPDPVRVSAEEVAAVAERLSSSLSSSDPSLPVPLNFEVTAPAHGTPGAPPGPRGGMPRGGTERNPQTLALLSALGLPFVEDGAGPPDVAAVAGGLNGGEAGAVPLPPPPPPTSAEEAVVAAAARVAAAGGAPPRAVALSSASAIPTAAAAAVDPAEIDIDGDGDGDLFEDPGAIHNMGQG